MTTSTQGRNQQDQLDPDVTAPHKVTVPAEPTTKSQRKTGPVRPLDGGMQGNAEGLDGDAEKSVEVGSRN